MAHRNRGTYHPNHMRRRVRPLSKIAIRHRPHGGGAAVFLPAARHHSHGNDEAEATDTVLSEGKCSLHLLRHELPAELSRSVSRTRRCRPDHVLSRLSVSIHAAGACLPGANSRQRRRQSDLRLSKWQSHRTRRHRDRRIRKARRPCFLSARRNDRPGKLAGSGPRRAPERGYG